MNLSPSIVRRPRNMEKRNAAFTLVELLLAVGILVVLGAVSFSVYRGAANKQAQLKEVAAARHLIAAYLNHASDHNGQVIVGFYDGAAGGAGEITQLQVAKPDGTRVETGLLAAYPFRLAPYFGFKLDEVLLSSFRVDEFRKEFGGSYEYGILRCPSFGLNRDFLGGISEYNFSKGANAIKDPDEVVRRITDVPKPSSMIVFATAQTRNLQSEVDGVTQNYFPGFHYINPPAYRVPLWGSNGADSHVDPRYGQKAICAFLDGSVRSHTLEELTDMRLWSKQAQLANNASYRVKITGGGGLGGGGRN